MSNQYTGMRKFPAEALRSALGGGSVTDLARACQVDRTQMQRYLRDGIPETAADRIAVRVGLHPGEVWSEWFMAEVS
jgi:lambda repressor-like predicted transcriptional regulator